LPRNSDGINIAAVSRIVSEVTCTEPVWRVTPLLFTHRSRNITNQTATHVMQLTPCACQFVVDPVRLLRDAGVMIHDIVNYTSDL